MPEDSVPAVMPRGSVVVYTSFCVSFLPPPLLVLLLLLGFAQHMFGLKV